MILDSHRIVFTFRSLLELQCVVLAVLVSILKSSNHFKTIDSGLQLLQE